MSTPEIQRSMLKFLSEAAEVASGQLSVARAHLELALKSLPGSRRKQREMLLLRENLETALVFLDRTARVLAPTGVLASQELHFLTKRVMTG